MILQKEEMAKITLCHNILTKDGWVRSMNINKEHKIAVLDENFEMFYSDCKSINIMDVCKNSFCFIKSRNINLFVSLDISIEDGKLEDLIYKNFTIRKTCNGLKGVFNNKSNVESGTYEFKTKIDADKKQLELIEQGYSVDREIVIRFNDTVGHKVSYTKENNGDITPNDYIYVYPCFNDVLEIQVVDDTACYFCVERCGKTAWIPIKK